jgi:hypothetical protein
MHRHGRSTDQCQTSERGDPLTFIQRHAPIVEELGAKRLDRCIGGDSVRMNDRARVQVVLGICIE